MRDIIALIRGGGSDQQFSVLRESRSAARLVRETPIRGCGSRPFRKPHGLDLLSDFAATTPGQTGAHIADVLRARLESQQQIANVQTETEELRMQLHHTQQMQHAT